MLCPCLFLILLFVVFFSFSFPDPCYANLRYLGFFFFLFRFLFCVLYNSVLLSYRIIVLDAGQIAEFDDPQTLLQNHDSIFYGMAKDAGLV